MDRNRNDNPTPAPRSRRGLSVAEAMVSLVISATLLTAVATAYNSSAGAIEANDRFFRATQSGRVTLNQILTEIRRADSVVVSGANDSVIITRPPANRTHAEEESREYKYDAAAKRITFQIFYKRPNGTTYSSPLYRMAGDVTSAAFGPPEQVKTAAGQWIDVRVPVYVEVKLGGNQVRVDGSSSPRRLSLK